MAADSQVMFPACIIADAGPARQGPGAELLLATGRRFASPAYSALARFGEPSESLEDCVWREVQEETELNEPGEFHTQPVAARRA